jgi:hypothetical protein
MAIDKGFQWSSDPQMALRMQLAQGLMQGQQAPAQSLGENVANLSSKLVGAFMMKKAMDDGRGRDDARNATLANALQAGQGQAAETKSYGDGTTINWNERKADPNQMAAILASNRDTAPMGMQMQIGQMDAKAKGEAEMAKLLREHNLSIERDRMKPLDISDGKQWYVPDLPGQATAAPPAQAPVAPPGPDLRTVSAAPNPPQVEQQSLAQPAFNRTPGYATNVTGIENATGNPNAKNPNSSATGDGQFISATWLDLMKRNRPDLVQGKSDADILALRADPNLSREMIDVYGMENTDYLKAGGIQNVGDAEKYAAHFFGPTGAVKVLKADPNASFASILPPEVIKANPHLTKMTVGQWRDQNATKFGGGAQPPAAPPANTALADALVPGAGRMTVGGQSGTVVGGGQSGPKVRSLTPDEVAQNGLPKGTVAQVNRDGQVTVVSKPDKVDGPGKNERDWRGEFKEPIKQATELTSQVGIVRNAAKVGNGTADTALIIAFNKLLDPGAVVREADVALTRQAQSVMEQVNTWMANKAEGDILPEQLRQRISGLTEQIYATSNSVLRDRVMPYREAAESEGANWDRIIPPKMRTSLGWDDQPDPNAWQTVDIPKDLQTPKPAATKLAGNVPTFATPDDPGLAALPSGTEFFDPNGVRRIKP